MTPGPNRLTRRQVVAGTSVLSATLAAPHLANAQTPAASPAASPVAMPAQFFLATERVRYDERFEFGVGVVEPGEVVTIEATLRKNGVETGVTSATYEANEWGSVDPSVQIPIEGDFDVADCMAFIWASPGARIVFDRVIGDQEIVLRALVGGDVIAEATVIRTGLDESHTHETLDSPDLVADYFAPPGEGPFPAMIVLGGSEGGRPSQDVPTLLAMHGYATLAVAYFNESGLPDQLENIPLEYFGNAITWLKERPEVDPERIGVIGNSRGGELALLFGSYYPELTTVVSVVGSGIVSPGIDWSDMQRTLFPAWTWQGEAIPHLTYNVDYDDPDAMEPITIKVEQINGPVMMISGEADELWPSADLSRYAWDRLQAADREWPDEFLTYPGAGHIIRPPYQPMTFGRSLRGLPLGGNPRDDTAAGVDSWQAILNMLAWRFRNPD